MKKRYLAGGLSVVLIILFCGAALATEITPETMGTTITVNEDQYIVDKAFSYTVQRGDNLHWIAAKTYGDARLWVQIYQANSDKIMNPNVLEIGQVLVIPPYKPE
ncbi:LysM peptidoglycan-binding domain-containing protein [Thermodesulfobacteriota bacterium]